MTDPTTVRRIRCDEGLRWRALRLQALADNPVAYVDTVAEATGRSDRHWHSRAAGLAAGCREALFVAERYEEWIGVAGGFADPGGSTTVFTVFVERSARGQGVLEALLDTVARWSINCGRQTLSLEVAVQNSRAHAAYRRLGWVATGAARPHPLYPEVTEIEMTRPAGLPFPRGRPPGRS